MSQRMVRITVIVMTLMAAFQAAIALADPPDQQNAIDLYEQANSAIVIVPPSSRSTIYDNCPSLSPAWQRDAADMWSADGKSFAIAHAATALFHENLSFNPMECVKHLNPLRNVCNLLGDSAVYCHLHHQDAQAIGEIQDLLHVDDLLRQSFACFQVVKWLSAMGMEDLV